MARGRMAVRVVAAIALIAVASAPGQIVSKGPRPSADIVLDLRAGWEGVYRLREVVTERTRTGGGPITETRRTLEVDLALSVESVRDDGTVELAGRVTRLDMRAGGRTWVCFDQRGDSALCRAVRAERVRLVVDPRRGLTGVRVSGGLAERVAGLADGAWDGAMEAGWAEAFLAPAFDAEGRVGEEVELTQRWSRGVTVELGELGPVGAKESWEAAYAVEAKMGFRAGLSGWSARGGTGGRVGKVSLEALTLWDTAGDVLAERTSVWRATGNLADGREYSLERARSLEQRWARGPVRGGRRGR